MDEARFEGLAALRVLLGLLASILLFVAGHHLRHAGAEADAQALGLMAYGLSCLALAIAIPVAVALSPWSRVSQVRAESASLEGPATE